MQWSTAPPVGENGGPCVHTSIVYALAFFHALRRLPKHAHTGSTVVVGLLLCVCLGFDEASIGCYVAFVRSLRWLRGAIVFRHTPRGAFFQLDRGVMCGFTFRIRYTVDNEPPLYVASVASLRSLYDYGLVLYGACSAAACTLRHGDVFVCTCLS